MSTHNAGYVLIARGLLDHPQFKPRGPFSDLEAWLWFIIAAAHTPRDVPASNGRQRITVHLEPGQLTFSVRFLAQAWTWSDKRVQRFLSALVEGERVTTKTSTGQTIITICNWHKYQNPTKIATTQTTTQATTQSTTQSTTKKKELKELNSDVVGADATGVLGNQLSSRPPALPANQAAVALGLAFLNAAGFGDHSEAPMNWYGVTDRAAMWIERGWPEAMIVEETKITAARASSDALMPLSYFEKVFATAFAKAQRPLPVATIPPPETTNVLSTNQRRGGNLAGASDRLLAEARPREAGRVGNLAGVLDARIADALRREQAERERIGSTDQTATVLNSWPR